MKIVLIGAPGAGKGTYAQILREKYCIPHISTGDIFREEIARDTELGRVVKSYIEKGLLVPDEIVIEVVSKRLKQPDASRGFILDGFPRTLEQAKALDEIVDVDAVVHLVVSEEVAVRRLSGRRICPVCNRVYNIYYEPKPREDEKCDYDGAQLIRRPDDEPEVVRNRYRVFYETFKPIIEYYRVSNKLIEVDSNKSIKEVFPVVEEVLRRNKILRLQPCKEDVRVG
ncbi:MAG: adenylate kinase [Desulfurococcus sp.]|uniref:adenylate kinase n=1 Tax=Desulfurococcus sp. TaxID=51678 RepID=UPI00315EEF7D